jgi:hypothetical protein
LSKSTRSIADPMQKVGWESGSSGMSLDRDP